MRTAALGAGAERRVLDTDELLPTAEGITGGTYATICAATRTRRRWTLLSVDGPQFRALRQLDTGWTLLTGPADRLAGEVVGIPGDLESVTGTRVAGDGPPAETGVPPLGPGELLALAEVVRRGDAARIQAACDDLELAGLPWWVAQFAWGAEAVLSLVLTVHDRPHLASMLHLLPSGWGCLHADADGDLSFRPMSPLEVQARLGAFTALLVECAHV